MSNRVVITIDLPDGVVPDVQYQTRQSAPAPAAVPPPAAGATSWSCPEHGSERVKQGRYGPFCTVKGGNNVNAKGYCDHKPGALTQAGPPPPAAPPPSDEYDSLPF